MHTILYKVEQKSLIVIDELNIESRKTKDFITLIKPLNLSNKVLIISDDSNDNMHLASRNLANVKVIKSVGVNVYDLLNYKSILIDKKALSSLLERVK